MGISTVTISSQSRSPGIQINLAGFGFGVGMIGIVSPGASLTWEVDVSGDNVNWNAHDTMNGLTANQNGNLQFPVAWVSLNVTSYVSGSVTLWVIQV